MRAITRPTPALLIAVALALSTGTGSAQTVAAPGLPITSAEEVGLSREVLAEIGPAMQRLVDEGRTGGVMTLVARQGRIVHWEATGWRVLGEDPLERDDIFRIYSMTKPITSVAAMMLVEAGELALDDELGDFVPAFRDVRVYESPGTTRLPERPITIRHLLTHTSGLTYGVFGETPVDSLYRAAGLGVGGSGGDLEATVAQIASLPLLSDPGSQWTYSVSTDVLGRVVEVASGMPLAEFFHQRIFEPLGMRDSGFYVRADSQDRFTAVYGPGRDGLRMIDAPDGRFTRTPDWPSGGGGLTSSAMDYLRFSQMLLNEGELDGVRLLEPETVRLMRRNHLPDDLMPIGIGGADQGFGLGFAVSTGDDAGVFWWAGVANTYFWIDPGEEIVGFAWTQYMPFGAQPIDGLLRRIVYRALTEGG